MKTLKNTVGLSGAQIANGTPSDKLIKLVAFYKGDKCTISPAKDINQRYLGINENIPEIKKLEMGYVPSIESRIKLYDGIEIDLNNKTWAADWEWMQHCVEIADDFETGQGTPGAYFYIFRPGFESAKKVSDTEKRVKLMNYILNDSAENLYNRASILGVDMTDSVISDVKEYLLGMVNTEPSKLEAVYESKTFSLELLFMHALKKGVITKRNGVFTFGEILLGVEDRAVVAFFANPKNHITTKAIEAVTYGNRTVALNPLENEAVQGTDLGDEIDASLHNYDDDDDNVVKEQVVVEEETIKTSTLGEADDELSPQQKAAITRKRNADKASK